MGYQTRHSVYRVIGKSEDMCNACCVVACTYSHHHCSLFLDCVFSLKACQAAYSVPSFCEG